MFKNPLMAYNFFVYAANIPLGFQKISSVEMALETETILEGGCYYAHVLPAPPKQVCKMTFSKGAGTCLDSVFPFKVGQYVPGDIHIFLMGDMMIYGETIRIIRKHYYIQEALVTRWSISEMDATRSETLIETFEIQYSVLEQVPVEEGKMDIGEW